MEVAKNKHIILDAGDIISWKQYSMFTVLWCKIINKKLKYNRFMMLPEKAGVIKSVKLRDVRIFEPIRKYNNKEASKLSILMGDKFVYKNWKELAYIINMVRPNTIADNTSIEECKYYKGV